MHPFTELYSRLISLCGLSLRLGGVTVVVGVLAAMCHYSGLWDVAYQVTPPLPCTQLLTTAQSNPLLWLDRRVLGRSSFTDGVILRCPPASIQRPILSVTSTPWRLLWNWLSATRPFSHNPFPTLRAVRWQDTRQTLTFFLAYYCANVLALIALTIAGIVLWALVVVGLVVRNGIRPRHSPLCSDRPLRRTPLTLDVATTPFVSLELPDAMIRFLASCRTARRLMGIFAAHQTWPASLSHHGHGSGGLLAHTLRAFRLALAHPGATDPTLGVPFLVTVLAHDVGKVLAYAPRSTGGFQLTSYYHANRSADVVMAAGLWREFSPQLTEAMLTALRSSAAPSLVPIPENAPSEAAQLLGWLHEVDRHAVREDVTDLHTCLVAADVHALLPALFAATAPTPDLPAPLYRDGGTPYVLRESARLVLLSLLQLDDHPGARATTGRKDPVWDRLKEALSERGVAASELRLTLPMRARPFQALAIPPALVEGHIPEPVDPAVVTEVPL